MNESSRSSRSPLRPRYVQSGEFQENHYVESALISSRCRELNNRYILQAISCQWEVLGSFEESVILGHDPPELLWLYNTERPNMALSKNRNSDSVYSGLSKSEGMVSFYIA